MRSVIASLAIATMVAGCDVVFGLTPPDPEWRQISGGLFHTCAVRTDRSLWCWGENSFGQLGLADVVELAVPTQVGTSSWREVAAGWSHTCAINLDDELWCWGSNVLGEAGTGTMDLIVAPTKVLTGVTAVAAGTQHTCALLVDSSISCWGDNTFGQVGAPAAPQVVRLPLPLVSAQQWRTVGAIGQHTCATDDDDRLWCWGNNTAGQVSGTPGASGALQPIEPGFRWRSIAAGDRHTCGLRDDDALRCWGELVGGSANEPVTVPPGVAGASWTQVSAGLARACALQDDATLWCWGFNSQGQLGDPTANVFEPRPVPIGAPSRWTAVTLGGLHLCALDEPGRLWCAGNDGLGQLGTGIGGSRHTPTAIPGTWTDVAVGPATICARASAGGVWCWGDNEASHLGDASDLPRQQPGLTYAVSATGTLAVGGRHACATNDDSGGSVLACWGDNERGAAGIATPSTMPVIETPMAVPTIQAITQVAAGEAFTCAVAVTGNMWCWGTNEDGQLAKPPDTGPQSAPTSVTVGGAQGWGQVAAGARHACATNTNDDLYCWGDNTEGQRGSIGIDPPPQLVLPTNNWQSVAAGDTHTCAIDSAKHVHCWGGNYRGQLGDGSVANRPTPSMIGTRTTTAIALGANHTCALGTDRTLACWGDNGRGQLGLEARGTQLPPAAVPTVGTAQWVKLSAGGDNTCAIQDDETLWCWGANGSGQLGDGSAWSGELRAVVVP